MSGRRGLAKDYSSLTTAYERSRLFLEKLPERMVVPDDEALARLESFRPTIPQAGREDGQLIEELASLGELGAVASAGPRYFGYVIGGALPATVAASWLSAAWDQAASDYRLSPLGVRLEEITGDWLLDLLKLPPHSALNYVTGSTMASFVGLAVARAELMRRTGWDMHADGIFGSPTLRAIVSEESHPSILKVLNLLGFGAKNAIRVPVDNQGRMIAERLPELGPDCIICAQAGNVNSGAFDPLSKICDRAAASGAWVHVDGAFGLMAAASNAHEHLLDGHSRADSWAFDAHKWLNTPYDCGVAICRDREAVARSFSYQASYLENAPRNPRNLVPELSRRARAIEVWAALNSLGRDGLRELVEVSCANARMFADGLHRSGFQILNDVVLNQCLAARGTPAQMERIAQDVQRSGIAWLATTTWQGQTALRINCTSWATAKADVERTLEAIASSARRVFRD